MTHTISYSRNRLNYESPADADRNNMYHVTIVTTDNEDASTSLPLVIMVDERGRGRARVTFSTTQPAVEEAYHGHSHRRQT